MPDKCVWTWNNDDYRQYGTDCGWLVYHKERLKSDFKFCPYCSREIEEKNRLTL